MCSRFQPCFSYIFGDFCLLDADPDQRGLSKYGPVSSSLGKVSIFLLKVKSYLAVSLLVELDHVPVPVLLRRVEGVEAAGVGSQLFHGPGSEILVDLINPSFQKSTARTHLSVLYNCVVSALYHWSGFVQ